MSHVRRLARGTYRICARHNLPSRCRAGGEATAIVQLLVVFRRNLDVSSVVNFAGVPGLHFAVMGRIYPHISPPQREPR